MRGLGAIGRRIAIVDSSPVVRDGLPLLLPQFSFAGSFTSCEELLRQRPHADVVLLDLHLIHPGAADVHHGVDTVVICREAGYQVCVYSHEHRDHLLLRCLEAGATGIASKDEPTLALATVLETMLSGGVALSAAFADLGDLTARGDGIPSLSVRQEQVLAARARGEPFRQIARRLSISEKTAQEHWALIAAKFATYLERHSAADLERVLGLDSSEQFWHLDLAAS